MTTTVSGDDSRSFTSLWNRTQQLYDKYINNSDDISDDELIKVIAVVKECVMRIEDSNLVSKNEEIDDITTSTLPYLCITYYLGKILCLMKNLRERQTYLIDAITYFKRYIKLCHDLHIVHDNVLFECKVYDNDHSDGDSSSSSAIARERKIAKYRKEKEMKEKIKLLKDVIAKAQMDDSDLDEETRSLLLLQMQSYVYDSINEISIYTTEVKLLDHMSELRELEDEFNVNPQQSSRSTTDRSGVIPGLPELPPLPYKEGEGPGIEVTTTSKLGGQLVMSRQTVHTTVFEPRMSKPTMTLEEFADMQLADAMHRSEKEGNAEKGPRRYNQLHADGDEDDDKLVDIATTEDRDWDNFKDHNPRGWGNKMGKRC